MKYLMLIYGNEEKWASFPAEAWPEAISGRINVTGGPCSLFRGW